MPNSAVKPLILVVEDDPAVRNLIVAALEAHGLRHMAVETAHAAIAAASSQAPSIVLLDLGLPDMDGVKVVESVRTWSGMPIIVVSARSEDADKIRALDAGADDYLTKPFDTRELLACINALLRRQGKQVDELVFGNTSLDLDTCTLVCGGKSVRLSAREFDVMRFLLQAQDRILSKEMILSRVWGYDSNAVENHVEVYIGFLRKKLASIGSDIRIEAIRRLGYHLEVDEPC